MVYLELQGGKERGLELVQTATTGGAEVIAAGGYAPRPRPLASRLTETERAAHVAFLAEALKGKSIWPSLGEAGLRDQ